MANQNQWNFKHLKTQTNQLREHLTNQLQQHRILKHQVNQLEQQQIHQPVIVSLEAKVKDKVIHQV